MTATEILIAAHGEAWTCSPDSTPAPGSLAGLSGDGARQSRLLAAALARETGARGAFGAVYSCPSLRCLETAGPIAAARRSLWALERAGAVTESGGRATREGSRQ